MLEARTELDRLKGMDLREAQAFLRDRARQGGDELAALEKSLAEASLGPERAWWLLLRCYGDPQAGFAEIASQLADSGAVGLTGWDRGWSSGWLPSLVARRVLTAPDLVPPHRRDPEALDPRETVLWLRVLAEAPSLTPEDRAFLRASGDDPDLEVWPHAARAWGRNALHDEDLRREMFDEVFAHLRDGRVEFPSAVRRRRARAAFVAFCAFLSASPLPAEPGAEAHPEPPFETLPSWVQGIIRGHATDFFPARISADLDLAAVLIGSDCLLEVDAYRPRLRDRLTALLAFLERRPCPLSTELVGSLLARAVRAGHLDAKGVEMLQTLAAAWGKFPRERGSERLAALLVFEHLARSLAEMACGEARVPATEAIVELTGMLPWAPEVARTAVWEALWAVAAQGELTPNAKTWLTNHASRGLDFPPVGSALVSAETFEFVHAQRWLAHRVGAEALARAGVDGGMTEGPWVGPLWRDTVASLLRGLAHAAAWNLLSATERVLWVWRLAHLFEAGILPPGVQIADVLALIGQAPSPGTEEYGGADARAQLLLELFVRASELDGEAWSVVPRLARIPRQSTLAGALHVIRTGPSGCLDPFLALDLRRPFRRIAADHDATFRDLCRLAASGARPPLFALLADALRDAFPVAADLADAVGEGVHAAPDPSASVAIEERVARTIEGRPGAFLDVWRAARAAWRALEALEWEDPQADLSALERGISAAAAMVAALRDTTAAPPAWASGGPLAPARDKLGSLMPALPADLAGLEPRWRGIADAVLELRRGVADALPPLERSRWEAATAGWGARIAGRRAKAAALETEGRACQPAGTRTAEAVGRLAAAAKGLLPSDRAERLLAAYAEQWMAEALSSSAPADAAERLLSTASAVLAPTQRHVLVWTALCAALDRGGEADVRAWYARLDAPTHAERKRVAHWWLERYDVATARRVMPELAGLWPLHHAPTLLGVFVGYLGMLACGSVWAQLAASGAYVQLGVLLVGGLVAAGVCAVWDLQERGVLPRGLPSTTALADGLGRAASLLGVAATEALLLNLAGQVLLSHTDLGWGRATWAGAVELVLTTSAVTLFLGVFVGAAAFRRSTTRSVRG